MADATIYNPQMTEGIDIAQPATRTRYGNTVYLSGAPDGSNYTSNDAGITVIDESVSPPDEYRVTPTGSLIGPL